MLAQPKVPLSFCWGLLPLTVKHVSLEDNKIKTILTENCFINAAEVVSNIQVDAPDVFLIGVEKN